MVYTTLRMFHDKSVLDERAVWERLIGGFFRERNTQKPAQIGETMNGRQNGQSIHQAADGSEFAEDEDANGVMERSGGKLLLKN